MYKYNPQVRAEEEGAYTTYNPLCTISRQGRPLHTIPTKDQKLYIQFTLESSGKNLAPSVLKRSQPFCPFGCTFGCQETWAFGRPSVEDSKEALLQT